jgi:Ankyrin repeats (3 copies)
VAAVASAAGRNVVLGELIRIGIDPSRRDKYNKSASFYASRNGHKEAVELLHAAGARVNDSSLQEAAREGHEEIIRFLLANGHRADFPSGLHADGVFGRTALEELCLKSAPREDVQDWKKRMHQCIKQLLPDKGTEVEKTGGKSIIHFAVENSNPLPVTRAILDFPAIWECINGPVHLFQDDGEGYFYSPTKYVEHFCTTARPETKAQLISLLRENKCEDKFYAHTVIQPKGAVGLPEDIAFAVDKQKRADHEHSEAIKRQKDLVARQRATDAEDYQRRTATDKERHEQLMRAQREREDGEKAIAQRKQATARTHAQELERARQAAVTEESRLRVQAMREEAARRKDIQDAQQASELHHKRNLAKQEYAAMETRMNMESQIIAERDRASRVEAARVMDLLSKREATAKYEAQLRASRSG